MLLNGHQKLHLKIVEGVAITKLKSIVIRTITVKTSPLTFCVYPKEENEKRTDYNKSI